MASVFHSTEYAAVIAFLIFPLNFVSGGKLLVEPTGGSHWLSMRPLLNQLKQNGHEIVVVAPDANVQIKASDIYTLKTYPVPFTKEELEKAFQDFAREAFQELPFLVRFVRIFERMRESSAFFLSSCKHLLYNQELMRYIEESKFDALLTNPIMPCGQIIADHVGIPSVFYLQQIPCGLHSVATQCPSPPSYVPRGFTRNTDQMTFAQRVKNMMFYMSEFFLCDFVYSPYASLASEFLQREMSIPELLSHGSVWLMKIDFVAEHPKPLMPNMVLIGGINCAGRKQLPQVCNYCYLKSMK